jgi:hypothetical protein
MRTRILCKLSSGSVSYPSTLSFPFVVYHGIIVQVVKLQVIVRTGGVSC